MQDIELIEPKDKSVTRPLQRHGWPLREEKAGERPFGPDEPALAPIFWDDIEIVAEDRSFPEAVVFAWRIPAVRERPLAYDLLISRNEDLRDARIVPDLRRSRVSVFHLHIGTRYFWKVIARHQGLEVAQSQVWSFVTHAAPPRWIAVPGITNVRDMGGWPLPGGRIVRQGLIYRSSEMNSHVEITEEGKRILIEELGIRTDLDLRGNTEDARPVLDTRRVEWIHVSVQPYDAIGDARHQDGYRRVFEVLADAAKYPLLFHCWGGADRAGTVAFLLSALLGKNREHLFRDYELTSLSIWGLRSRWSVECQSLLRALEPYDEGGNINRQVENYLRFIGIPAAHADRIREILIANAESPG
jgi:protein-tyrosine phosphatase